MTMLIAGHETTAVVLTWAVFLLAQHPVKMKKAQSEIDAVLGQGRTTFESLKKLEYLRLIVVESLRLYPQPPLLIRRSLTSDKLPGGYNGDKDGYEIPAGTDVFLSIISDFAFLPFGGGPRKCVGDQFALMESTIALAMFLQKFDVELRGSPEDVELVTGATIHTKTGLWCKIKKRSNI